MTSLQEAAVQLTAAQLIAQSVVAGVRTAVASSADRVDQQRLPRDCSQVQHKTELEPDDDPQPMDSSGSQPRGGQQWTSSPTIARPETITLFRCVPELPSTRARGVAAALGEDVLPQVGDQDADMRVEQLKEEAKLPRLNHWWETRRKRQAAAEGAGPHSMRRTGYQQVEGAPLCQFPIVSVQSPTQRGVWARRFGLGIGHYVCAAVEPTPR